MLFRDLERFYHAVVRWQFKQSFVLFLWFFGLWYLLQFFFGCFFEASATSILADGVLILCMIPAYNKQISDRYISHDGACLLGVFGTVFVWMGITSFGNVLLTHVPIMRLSFVRPATNVGPVWEQLAASLFLAPICEEFLFRGFLYDGLRMGVKDRVSLATLLSGLLFGLAHGSVVYLIVGTVFGMFLSLFYECTGSLFYSIMAHSLFNLLTIFGGAGLANVPNSLGGVALSGILFAGVLLLLLSLYRRQECGTMCIPGPRRADTGPNGSNRYSMSSDVKNASLGQF